MSYSSFMLILNQGAVRWITREKLKTLLVPPFWSWYLSYFVCTHRKICFQLTLLSDNKQLIYNTIIKLAWAHKFGVSFFLIFYSIIHVKVSLKYINLNDFLKTPHPPAQDEMCIIQVQQRLTAAWWLPQYVYCLVLPPIPYNLIMQICEKCFLSIFLSAKAITYMVGQGKLSTCIYFTTSRFSPRTPNLTHQQMRWTYFFIC